MSGRVLYEQDDYPVFQNRMFPTCKAARECHKGTIRIIEDCETGIVSNAAFDPALVIYDSEYQNEQGNSASFLQHLRQVSELVLRTMGRRALVEVGCGKAFFLEMLQQHGAEVVGFDPTYEGTNPAVEKRYFSRDIGMRGKGLILRHVLEHVQSPAEFLALLAEANDDQGLIYIEVPCFDWICQHRAWFDIYYEHVNYFRLSDFERMFGRVVEQGHLFGGQYIYVVADLATIRRPRFDPSDQINFPADFTRSLARLDQIDSSCPAVIWGGASKGVIFALLAERAGRPIDRVIDINPAKQGSFIAGTGLEVSSPEAGLAGLPQHSLIYVMNPNYIDEIGAQTGGLYTYIGVGDD